MFLPKRIFIILVVCLCIFHTSVFAYNDNGLKDDDFKLAGISLVDKIDKVYDLYGSAISYSYYTVKGYGGTKESTFQHDVFDGFEIDWCKKPNIRIIAEVSVNSPKYSTNRGIVVGDDISKVISKYGYQYDYRNSAKNKNIVLYSYSTQAGVSLTFYYDRFNKRIVEITADQWAI